MKGREIFKIWAPNGVFWSAWVRPVMFLSLDTFGLTGLAQLEEPTLFYTEGLTPDCAVFLDLPDYHAVEESLALSRLGYRPVPLYNSTDAQAGTKEQVDNDDIGTALCLAAETLKSIPIQDDAPPAFLLDHNRMDRVKRDVTVFDNSWDLYSQDIPSPETFLSRGIHKILIRGLTVNKALRTIFYDFQKKGIAFYFTDGFKAPKPIRIRKPLFP